VSTDPEKNLLCLTLLRMTAIFKITDIPTVYKTGRQAKKFDGHKIQRHLIGQTAITIPLYWLGEDFTDTFSKTFSYHLAEVQPEI
jgi:hypothetical protein